MQAHARKTIMNDVRARPFAIRIGDFGAAPDDASEDGSDLFHQVLIEQPVCHLLSPIFPDEAM